MVLSLGGAFIGAMAAEGGVCLSGTITNRLMPFVKTQVIRGGAHLIKGGEHLVENIKKIGTIPSDDNCLEGDIEMQIIATTTNDAEEMKIHTPGSSPKSTGGKSLDSFGDVQIEI